MQNPGEEMKPKFYRVTITMSRRASSGEAVSIIFASQNFKTHTAAFKHSWNLAQGLEEEAGGGCVAIEKLTRAGWSVVGYVSDGEFFVTTR